MDDGKLILWEGITVTCTEKSKSLHFTNSSATLLSPLRLPSPSVSPLLLFLLLFSHHTSQPHTNSQPRSTHSRIYLQLALKLPPKVCNVVPSCNLAQAIRKWTEINAGTTKVAMLPLSLTVMAILWLVVIRRLTPHLKLKSMTLQRNGLY